MTQDSKYSSFRKALKRAGVSDHTLGGVSEDNFQEISDEIFAEVTRTDAKDKPVLIRTIIYETLARYVTPTPDKQVYQDLEELPVLKATIPGIAKTKTVRIEL